MSRPRLISFYLPQFYPTKENDEWWGKGFTEWTNVGRAKPLFKGHYQPKVPADLGYYDLRIPEVREQQVLLAKEAGIEGFCYWHYWFAGRRLLDVVFKEVVELGKPDFPFCLCWANHSWYQKTWDPTKPDKLLIEQTYPGEQDYIDHFYAMLPAFKDERYMKVGGKLIFGLFSPLDLPNTKKFFDVWNKLAKDNGINGFYFFGFTFNYTDKEQILKSGFDSVVVDNVRCQGKYKSIFDDFFARVKRKFFKIPKVTKYDEYMKYMMDKYTLSNNVHPCINPNFDHSPRSAHRGLILTNSTPSKWYDLCIHIFKLLKNREEDENLVFIKAWNEWGEGNYMEPDLRFGKQYIEKTMKALKNYDK